jgi:hypothetical protein
MQSPIFDRNFRLVEHSPEPTIREMIEHYYASHGTAHSEAKKLGERLIAAALLVEA